MIIDVFNDHSMIIHLSLECRMNQLESQYDCSDT